MSNDQSVSPWEAAQTQTLDELRALADQADETAESLWDAYRAARAEIEQQRWALDVAAERAEQASRMAGQQRAILRSELRAAGIVITAGGYAPCISA